MPMADLAKPDLRKLRLLPPRQKPAETVMVLAGVWVGRRALLAVGMAGRLKTTVSVAPVAEGILRRR